VVRGSQAWRAVKPSEPIPTAVLEDLHFTLDLNALSPPSSTTPGAQTALDAAHRAAAGLDAPADRPAFDYAMFFAGTFVPEQGSRDAQFVSTLEALPPAVRRAARIRMLLVVVGAAMLAAAALAWAFPAAAARLLASLR
jgi:hypothetical protein